MSVNLVNLFVQSYSTNLQLLLQQKGSLLRGQVSEGAYVGASASPVDQMSPIAMQQVTTRFGPMSRVDAVVSRRWVAPSDFELPQLVDSFDKLRLLTDPESAMVQNAVFAAGRSIDDIIIAAFSGAAQTGITGGSSTNFGTGNQVIGVNTGGTSSGLNVAKLRTVVKNAMNNQINLDAETLMMAITSKQHDELLNEVQVNSLDFNSKPVLVDGRVRQFMGITFVPIERLVTGTDDQSGTSTACYAWVKSGMHLGMWNDINTSISKRNDITGEPWQAYVKMTLGATRLDEKKVFKVWCR